MMIKAPTNPPRILKLEMNLLGRGTSFFPVNIIKMIMIK